MHIFNFLVIVCVILVTNLHTCLVKALEKEMTVNIDAGKEECFYENVKDGQLLEVDYQVIDGGQGDLDINFRLYAPTGRTIVADYKKADNTHRIVAVEAGDYRMCWDNKFSTFSSKTVFFEILADYEGQASDPWNDALENYEGLSPEEVYDVEAQSIEQIILRVRSNLKKVQHLQEQTRAFEARDRNVAESNYVRVNVWSVIQIIVMLVVGFIQVVMVKSLFDDKSCLHQIWKKVYSS
ncbi:transmembrane emp24 domain-containing protein 1 [Schistocerca nitens]|uniref:transmembrane emp24 domain-containing protein 1 n=1 Tax=Schistocerca nitens TaxID=7011 RepID=UPI0021189E4E|nr:transmembrane emp24 domain-containing protein 1 [Schistocerca nitens]